MKLWNVVTAEGTSIWSLRKPFSLMFSDLYKDAYNWVHIQHLDTPSDAQKAWYEANPTAWGITAMTLSQEQFMQVYLDISTSLIKNGTDWALAHRMAGVATQACYEKCVEISAITIKDRITYSFIKGAGNIPGIVFLGIMYFWNPKLTESYEKSFKSGRYMMGYGSTLWWADVIGQGVKGKEYYQICSQIPAVAIQTRNWSKRKGMKYDRFDFGGFWMIQISESGGYSVYSIGSLNAAFCGLLTRVSGVIFTLRRFGSNPYYEFQPGGFMKDPKYVCIPDPVFG
jgi:hypothetical protein